MYGNNWLNCVLFNRGGKKSLLASKKNQLTDQQTDRQTDRQNDWPNDLLSSMHATKEDVNMNYTQYDTLSNNMKRKLNSFIYISSVFFYKKNWFIFNLNTIQKVTQRFRTASIVRTTSHITKCEEGVTKIMDKQIIFKKNFISLLQICAN